MAVGTGKGERGGSLRGGMQMQLSRESLPLSGRFNGWESCYLHPEKGYVEEQFGGVAVLVNFFGTLCVLGGKM